MNAYIYGFHAVKQHIKSHPNSSLELLCLDSKNKRLQDVILTAKRNNIPVAQKNNQQLETLINSDKHQGCVLKIEQNAKSEFNFEQLLSEITDSSLILILDEIQDPHNLGACLRTADACGVQAVIIPSNNSADLTPLVSKVAAGGAETIPLIKVVNLSRSIKQLRQSGVWIVGTAGEAKQSIYNTQFKGATALVMGAEGSGMRRLTQENCDELIYIPMLGEVESLNVSVATGVSLFEINRQRQ